MSGTRTGWLVGLMLGVTFTVLSPGALAQSRARVGDLVELVTGLGPTLAEIVEGPDASGYVVISLPTGKQVPVQTQKLRLVQTAGTPAASMPVNERVRWVDGGVSEAGSVVKVNGNWCLVKTAGSTTIGWIECKALRAAAQATGPATPGPAVAATGKGMAVRLQGSWENADGSVKLEAQAGNKCFISFGPMTGACTYRPTASGVTILFDGEELVFNANEDGSLSSGGGPNALMSVRLKRK